MSSLRLLVSQIRYEQKTFWRNPAAGIFTIGFPIIFLLIFGSSHQSSKAVGSTGVSYDQYLIPAMLAYGLMNSCFSSLAVSMTIRRETGILKRVRGTPLPPYLFLGGVIGNSILISLYSTIILIAIGILEFNISWPVHLGAFFVIIFVGVVAFCAMGLAVTIFVPNADSAPAMVNGIYLPILFLSGVFFPFSKTSFLYRIGNFFPVSHFAQSLLGAFDQHSSGFGVAFHQIAIIAIWALIATWIAVRKFRWQPRK